MPTSLKYLITEHADRIERWKLIVDRYPDATLDNLPDGTEVFVSTSALDDMNEFTFVSSKGFGGKSYVSVIPYVTIGDIRVYAPPHSLDMSWITLSDKIKRKHPDAYALIAREIREYLKKA